MGLKSWIKKAFNLHKFNSYESWLKHDLIQSHLCNSGAKFTKQLWECRISHIEQEPLQYVATCTFYKCMLYKLSDYLYIIMTERKNLTNTRLYSLK